MMRDLAELNLNSPQARMKPTAKDFKKFEQEFEVILPTEYCQLLEFSNGGSLEIDSFVAKEGNPECSWSVNHFYHIAAEKGWDDLFTATRRFRARADVNTVPIAEDGGGNIIFLNYRHSTPTVCIWVHDEPKTIIKVASSFEAFIDSLQQNPDYI